MKQDHSLWGDRCVWTYLRYREQKVVGKNRIYRIMKENNLLVTKNMRLKVKRGELRSPSHYLNQFWHTQLPSLITDNGCQPTSERFMRDCASLGIKANIYKLY